MGSRLLGQAIALVFLVIPLAALPVGIWSIFAGHVNWIHISLFVVFYAISSFGITAGLHRYLTHRSFKTSRIIEVCFLIASCFAWQGTPLTWVKNHRRHHKYSDMQGDIHSPVINSLFYAHAGWLFEPDDTDPKQYAIDLLSNPRVLWISRLFILFATLSLLIPFLIAGWQGLLWGGLIRICFVHHYTWAVNSICHRYGKQPYYTGDGSRNNWLLSFPTAGESWHNNHHADPQSALHGFTPWQLDPTGQVILLLEKLHLVWDVKRPNPVVLARRTQKKEQIAA